VLQQEMEMYDTYQRRVAECDQELQRHLGALADTVSPPVKEELPPKKKKKENKNNPHFHLAEELQRITGVDLKRIDGGAPKAITAMAHRLARLVYRMLKYGQQYIDKGAEYYEQRNRQQQIEFLRKKAAQLGLQVTPAHV
jgi:hypothetical protein